MFKGLSLLILLVCAFSNNAETSMGTIEHLLNAMEQKLNMLEKKLDDVQKELDEQKQINQIKAIEYFAHKKFTTQNTCSEFNMEGNKLDWRETIRRMIFDEKLAGCQEREKVAFSAFLNRDLKNLGPGHTIQFGATRLNEGNAFNAQTGIFTVPIDGVYLFAFACEDLHNHRIYADIVVDGKRASLVLESPSGNSHAMGTNVVILRLTQGQSVWVAIDHGGHGNFLQNSATTFSGVFLYH